MKKVVLASLLTLATAAPTVSHSYAQTAAPAGSQACGSQVQMSQAEYAAYNNANTQTTPAAKAAAFEAYLKAYPNSCVKLDVLNQMLYAYTQAGDQANTLATADRVLKLDPNNIRALTLEVYYRRTDADKLTDATAKAAALDQVATYAQAGLNAPKPKDMSDADWTKLQNQTKPTFESAIADDKIAKKDNAGAITAIKAEIAADPDDTTKASPVLQDVYVLAQAYYTSTPPDYLNCAWYATRAVTFAPDAYKPQIQPLATYCYQKYHGNKDGYDALVALTKTNLDPPANLSATVTPAPKPEDIVAKTVASTPDLATLAISDKEFMLQYGAATDPKTQTSYADEVFNTVKGKSTQFPGVTVMDGSTADALKVAVTDDANTTKTADFTFQMKEPLKEVPATGTKVDIEGTYASYTPNPLMITMTDGALIVKKPTPVAHHTTHHAAARHR